eukprot:222850-Chlamydomonas_euryale.AAC.6
MAVMAAASRGSRWVLELPEFHSWEAVWRARRPRTSVTGCNADDMACLELRRHEMPRKHSLSLPSPNNSTAWVRRNALGSGLCRACAKSRLRGGGRRRLGGWLRHRLPRGQTRSHAKYMGAVPAAGGRLLLCSRRRPAPASEHHNRALRMYNDSRRGEDAAAAETRGGVGVRRRGEGGRDWERVDSERVSLRCPWWLNATQRQSTQRNAPCAVAALARQHDFIAPVRGASMAKAK